MGGACLMKASHQLYLRGQHFNQDGHAWQLW